MNEYCFKGRIGTECNLNTIPSSMYVHRGKKESYLKVLDGSNIYLMNQEIVSLMKQQNELEHTKLIISIGFFRRFSSIRFSPPLLCTIDFPREGQCLGNNRRIYLAIFRKCFMGPCEWPRLGSTCVSTGSTSSPMSMSSVSGDGLIFTYTAKISGTECISIHCFTASSPASPVSRWSPPAAFRFLSSSSTCLMISMFRFRIGANAGRT